MFAGGAGSFGSSFNTAEASGFSDVTPQTIDICTSASIVDPPSELEALAALRSRFGEYVRKYSVYSDIILLDPKGNVLARLDDQATARADGNAKVGNGQRPQ